MHAPPKQTCWGLRVKYHAKAMMKLVFAFSRIAKWLGCKTTYWQFFHSTFWCVVLRKGHFPRDKRVQLIYELAGMGLPGCGLNMTCQKTFACIHVLIFYPCSSPGWSWRWQRWRILSWPFGLGGCDLVKRNKCMSNLQIQHGTAYTKSAWGWTCETRECFWSYSSWTRCWFSVFAIGVSCSWLFLFIVQVSAYHFFLLIPILIKARPLSPQHLLTKVWKT